MHYFICAGTDPNEGHGPGYYQGKEKRMNVSLLVLIVSLLLHLFLGAKIIYFDYKSEKRAEPIELGVLNPTHDSADAPHSSETNPPIAIISGAGEKIRMPRTKIR